MVLATRLTENFRCYESGKDEHIWTTTSRRYGLSLGFGDKVALASRLTLLASLATANHQVSFAVLLSSSFHYFLSSPLLFFVWLASRYDLTSGCLAEY